MHGRVIAREGLEKYTSILINEQNWKVFIRHAKINKPRNVIVATAVIGHICVLKGSPNK